MPANTRLPKAHLGRVAEWVEHFAVAARSAAKLATSYLREVEQLRATWRAMLAHPVITGPIAAAVINRSKPQVYAALAQLEAAGVLVPLSQSRRNRSWEAVGLLDLLTGLEAGQAPDRRLSDPGSALAL